SIPSWRGPEPNAALPESVSWTQAVTSFTSARTEAGTRWCTISALCRVSFSGSFRCLNRLWRPGKGYNGQLSWSSSPSFSKGGAIGYWRDLGRPNYGFELTTPTRRNSSHL